jgi:hypothetical protein
MQRILNKRGGGGGEGRPKCPDSGLGAWDQPFKWTWEISTPGLGIEGWSVANFVGIWGKGKNRICDIW